jgi:hypothetical protein
LLNYFRIAINTKSSWKNYYFSKKKVTRNEIFFKIILNLQGQEEFEDTKAVIRIRMSKERQYNGQTKQKKTMIYKTLHRKLTIKHHKPDEDPLWYLQTLLTFTEHLSSTRLRRVYGAWSLVFCAVFCRSLFFLFFFVHCIVFPSTYGFWLPLI